MSDSYHDQELRERVAELEERDRRRQEELERLAATLGADDPEQAAEEAVTSSRRDWLRTLGWAGAAAATGGGVVASTSQEAAADALGNVGTQADPATKVWAHAIGAGDGAAQITADDPLSAARLVDAGTGSDITPAVSGGIAVRGDGVTLSDAVGAGSLQAAFDAIRNSSQGRGKALITAIVATQDVTASIPERSTVQGLGPETTQIQANSDIPALDIDDSVNARKQTVRDLFFNGFNQTTSPAILSNGDNRGVRVENVRVRNNAAVWVEDGTTQSFEGVFSQIDALDTDAANGGYTAPFDFSSGGFQHSLHDLRVYPTASRSGTPTPCIDIGDAGAFEISGTVNAGGAYTYVINDRGRIGTTIGGTVNAEPNSNGATAAIRHAGDGRINVSGRVLVNAGKADAPDYGIEIDGGGGGYLSKPETANGATPTNLVNVVNAPTGTYIYEGASGDVDKSSPGTSSATIECLEDGATVTF